MGEVQAVEGVSVGRKKSTPKPHNVKITQSAYEAARIACGTTGETLADYVSRVLEERAVADHEAYVKRKATGEKGA
jgi:hypothetical protein